MNVCLDVGQLHVLFMQINTYLRLPVGVERHLSLALNIHECAGQREREPFRAALYPLLFISAHILMERIKSEWPNREFPNDNGIHHTSVLNGKSPLRLPQSVLLNEGIVFHVNQVCLIFCISLFSTAIYMLHAYISSSSAASKIYKIQYFNHVFE